jgi:hypothetical protein
MFQKKRMPQKEQGPNSQEVKLVHIWKENKMWPHHGSLQLGKHHKGLQLGKSLKTTTREQATDYVQTLV